MLFCAQYETAEGGRERNNRKWQWVTKCPWQGSHRHIIMSNCFICMQWLKAKLICRRERRDRQEENEERSIEFYFFLRRRKRKQKERRRSTKKKEATKPVFLIGRIAELGSDSSTNYTSFLNWLITEKQASARTSLCRQYTDTRAHAHTRHMLPIIHSRRESLGNGCHGCSTRSLLY